MMEKNFYNRRPAYSKTLGSFTINKPLEKPLLRYKGGFIYLSIDPKSYLIGNGRFVPTFDDTDHLQFACANCFSIADILAVIRKGDVIYFWLGCPKCGKTGQRKIYLSKGLRRAFCHHAYFPEKGISTMYDEKDSIVGKWRIYTPSEYADQCIENRDIPPFTRFTRISGKETAYFGEKTPCKPVKIHETSSLRDSKAFINSPLGSPQAGESGKEVDA